MPYKIRKKFFTIVWTYINIEVAPEKNIHLFLLNFNRFKQNLRIVFMKRINDYKYKYLFMSALLFFWKSNANM